MTINREVKIICQKVKQASIGMAALSSEEKNRLLHDIAKNLRQKSSEILEANEIDVKSAKDANISTAKLDRLILDQKRLDSVITAIQDITALPDPTGKISYDVHRHNGLHIKRVTTPLGVILAIYESRPNVTSDIAALCLKSGNAVILRSGSESYHSSRKIAEIYQNSLNRFGIDSNAVFYIQNTDRRYVRALLKMENYIDVVVPRGGRDLIKAVLKDSKIAVFRHLDGNCHTYIENEADQNKARQILLNAKMRRTGICGATESLLIDRKIAPEILPLLVDDLVKAGCEVRGDKSAMTIDKRIIKAMKADFYTEYLDKIISVKIVRNLEEAVKHINHYGSSHTEAIITENPVKAAQFFRKVDSAIVMHNASTQFADGGEFGLGAEIGIATGKLHARGPVGLEQLVTYKYLVDSDFAIRN